MTPDMTPDIAPKDEAERARLAELNKWRSMVTTRPEDTLLDVMDNVQPGIKQRVLDKEAEKGVIQLKPKSS